ncbi:MAG: phenylalanine--tRNA ligase subunit beta [Alkaliphilus sp.]
MLAPLSWLKEYVNINIETSVLGNKMTMTGSKVEEIKVLGKDISGVVVGRIEEIKAHPNADKLIITIINVGEEELQIVTGATNVAVGDIVPVAVHGAKLANELKIRKGKLRGEVSEGMLCSPEELGILKSFIPEECKDGIWILDGQFTLGKDFMEELSFREDVIEFEITSNRPDCLSMLGIAREVSATIGESINYPEINFEKIEGTPLDKVEVLIEDNKGCKRYVARVIKDVTVKQSPAWLQQRLIKAGIRPINNVVDITNYVMLEYGQPLHAFDLDTVKTKKIVIRRATEETFKTLDGNERKLNNTMTVISDGEKTIAIAGVMGGEETEVKADTTTLLLESANFDRDMIKSTSKVLQLRTEASSRFEKGVDINIAKLAADRVCQLIELLECGKIVEEMIDVYPVRKEKRKLTIRTKKTNELLGTELKQDEMISILESLEIGAKKSGDSIDVLIPTNRDDLVEEADFIEEIARIYGFDKIESTMPKGSVVVGGRTYAQTIRKLSKEILNACGFNEILTYSFVSPKSIEKIRTSENSLKRKFVKLINPLGDETSVMRTTLVPNLLEVLGRNSNRMVKDVRAFELGNIFVPSVETDEKLPNEVENLVLGIYGSADFYVLKGMIEEMFKQLGIRDFQFDAEKYHSTYHPGRCANIIVKEQIIGTFGQVHPIVMENYGVNESCFIAEINYEALMQHVSTAKRYVALPKYPTTSRDFAIVVEENVYVKEIEEIIAENAGGILEKFELFDVYRGNQIIEGKKSVAYTLTYRHKNRTLTDEEVNLVQSKIIDEMKKILNADLREN